MDPQDDCQLRAGKYALRSFADVRCANAPYCTWVLDTVQSGPLLEFKQYLLRASGSPPLSPSSLLADEDFPLELFDASTTFTPHHTPSTPQTTSPPSKRVLPIRACRPTSFVDPSADALSFEEYLGKHSALQRLFGLGLMMAASENSLPSWAEPCKCCFTFRSLSGLVVLPRLQAAAEAVPLKRRVVIKLPAISKDLLAGFVQYLRARRQTEDAPAEGTLKDSEQIVEWQRLLAVSRFLAFVCDHFSLPLPTSADAADRMLVRFIADTHLWDLFKSQLTSFNVSASTLSNHLIALKHASDYSRWKLQRLAEAQEAQVFRNAPQVWSRFSFVSLSSFLLSFFYFLPLFISSFPPSLLSFLPFVPIPSLPSCSFRFLFYFAFQFFLSLFDAPSKHQCIYSFAPSLRFKFLLPLSSSGYCVRLEAI
jgi:hypothetical protein